VSLRLETRPFGIPRKDRVDDLMAPLPPGAKPLIPLEDRRNRSAPVEAHADLCKQLDQRPIDHFEHDRVKIVLKSDPSFAVEALINTPFETAQPVEKPRLRAVSGCGHQLAIKQRHHLECLIIGGTPVTEIRRQRPLECGRIGPPPEIAAARTPANGEKSFMFEHACRLLYRGDADTKDLRKLGQRADQCVGRLPQDQVPHLVRRCTYETPRLGRLLDLWRHPTSWIFE